jgi:quercetin dioxygenase-like cupin family protein
MDLEIVDLPPVQMMRHVALFQDLTGRDNGFPEYGVAGFARTMYNIVGFEAPSTTGKPNDSVVISPVGRDTPPAINTKAGFGVLILKCAVGNGTPNHNHDTNETFVVIDGRWRFYWGETSQHSSADHQFELGPLDAVSFPPGILRRFECIATATDSDTGTLVGIVAGDQPRAEYADDFNERLRELGKI